MDIDERTHFGIVKDQFEQYSNLPKLLKRFSFREKMAIATIHSSSAILFHKKMHSDMQYTGVLPWCIETFVMLSMEAKEYSNNGFRGRNQKKFLKMCNAIWDESSILSETPCGRFSALDAFLAVTCLTQFHQQELPLIRQYRYWHVFCNSTEPVYMKDIFKSKTGAEYEDFLLLGKMLQILFMHTAAASGRWCGAERPRCGLSNSRH